jgi:putative oxidoreductase
VQCEPLSDSFGLVCVAVSLAAMRYLFSTFPGQWPGLGLLLLRLAQAVSSILDARLYPWGLGEGVAIAILCAELLSSGLLAIGLWTPVAGVILAMVESIRIILGASIDGRPAALAVIGLSLAMLGPGSWSIDARLFGRKRIDLPCL